MRLPRREFEELVAAAIDTLPAEFRSKLENVEVVVEDWPTPDDLEGRRLAAGVLLLGLYRGVPLTERSVWTANTTPDQITIFQRPVERVSRTRRQIVDTVRRTVLHEIAHHFGISDERLRELGY
jgi:predicted Zn-dependent protease with MMP-like domain